MQKAVKSLYKLAFNAYEMLLEVPQLFLSFWLGAYASRVIKANPYIDLSVFTSR